MTQAKRDYDNERRRKRRSILVSALDGCCADCGAAEDLDFDHILRATKTFDISHGILKPWSVLLAELVKCQLLCHPCHVAKSARMGDDRSVPHGGGESGKKNCPCELCRERKRQYMKAYMRQYKRKPG